MKLRAQITIDIHVEDYIEAAEHQRRVEALMDRVRSEYEQADLIFRERRDRPPRRAEAMRPALRTVHYTGRLADYD